eukprot:g18124.t1
MFTVQVVPIGAAAGAAGTGADGETTAAGAGVAHNDSAVVLGDVTANSTLDNSVYAANKMSGHQTAPHLLVRSGRPSTSLETLQSASANSGGSLKLRASGPQERSTLSRNESMASLDDKDDPLTGRLMAATSPTLPTNFVPAYYTSTPASPAKIGAPDGGGLGLISCPPAPPASSSQTPAAKGTASPGVPNSPVFPAPLAPPPSAAKNDTHSELTLDNKLDEVDFVICKNSLVLEPISGFHEQGKTLGPSGLPAKPQRTLPKFLAAQQAAGGATVGGGGAIKKNASGGVASAPAGDEVAAAVSDSAAHDMQPFIDLRAAMRSKYSSEGQNTSPVMLDFDGFSVKSASPEKVEVNQGLASSLKKFGGAPGSHLSSLAESPIGFPFGGTGSNPNFLDVAKFSALGTRLQFGETAAIISNSTVNGAAVNNGDVSFLLDAASPQMLSEKDNLKDLDFRVKLGESSPVKKPFALAQSGVMNGGAGVLPNGGEFSSAVLSRSSVASGRGGVSKSLSSAGRSLPAVNKTGTSSSATLKTGGSTPAGQQSASKFVIAASSAMKSAGKPPKSSSGKRSTSNGGGSKSGKPGSSSGKKKKK